MAAYLAVWVATAGAYALAAHQRNVWEILTWAETRDQRPKGYVVESPKNYELNFCGGGGGANFGGGPYPLPIGPGLPGCGGALENPNRYGSGDGICCSIGCETDV